MAPQQVGVSAEAVAKLEVADVTAAIVPLLTHKALTTVIPWGRITDALNAAPAANKPEAAHE